ncbi:hypothetical protein EHO57_14200 [Leptospira langatensis]|uniref:Uncharacterized protein n=1 Tax=Leptospira langatensis TaxID=2484983 RepID=A0A5R2AT49_9LEPT|nr:hypothetical protein [Leptospira langatensis]TGJ99906.1 hypothetical protein EHO57_14200 [Leptospira langatensis]
MELNERIKKKVREEILKRDVFYEPMGQSIMLKDDGYLIDNLNCIGRTLARIRGWGRLRSKKSEQEAMELQDGFGLVMADLINRFRKGEIQ